MRVGSELGQSYGDGPMASILFELSREDPLVAARRAD